MKENTLLKNTIHNNKVSVYKHEVPSNREWVNSVYSYNKNYIKNLPQKDNYIYNLIKTYLHLVPVVNVSTKSKRLRDSLSRNSSKQIFISKPEIKQNSDKVSIMLYLYNREAKLANKKAFYFSNSLGSIINKMINTSTTKVVPKRRFTRKINLKKKLFNRYNAYNSRHNMFLHKNIMYTKNRIDSLFIYNFLKWSLSGFGYNIYVVKNNHSYTLLIDNNLYSKSYTFTSTNNNTTSYRGLNLLKVNKILITYLYMICGNKEKINVMLNYYSNKYLDKYLSRYIKKQQIAVKNIFKLHINKIRLGKLIVGLKSLIQNVYSKKIELNVINLKYLHLNADILTEAIAVKLRNKNSGILSIFKKAISLVKIPKINSSKNLFNSMNSIENFRLFDINNIINNKYLSYTSTNKDTISVVLQSIFPYKSLNFVSKFSNFSISKLLNTIYYRWVTGIRLEGKGRLTRRFTASRSVFKYKYRGSLKNLDHLNVPYYRKYTLNSMMIRNQYKSNIQYASTSNKKRVGVYGIKGWISNN